MNDCAQEMTLKQWVDTLSLSHPARQEYNALIRASKWLIALEAAGVDNWEGYDHARELMGD